MTGRKNIIEDLKELQSQSFEYTVAPRLCSPQLGQYMLSMIELGNKTRTLCNSYEVKIVSYYNENCLVPKSPLELPVQLLFSNSESTLSIREMAEAIITKIDRCELSVESLAMVQTTARNLRVDFKWFSTQEEFFAIKCIQKDIAEFNTYLNEKGAALDFLGLESIEV
jgi:hypothetical protein